MQTTTGTLTKSGTGTWTLTGASSNYSGNTLITAGTLAITRASDLGSGAGTTTVSSGATLGISGGLTVAETIQITGLGVGNNGAINFTSGDNTYSGNITLATAASSIGSLAGAQNISGTINGAQALTISATDNLTLTGTIGANAPPTSVTVSVSCSAACSARSNTGVLALNADVTTSGAQTYTGQTNINNGTVKLGASSSGLNSPL
ncbi:MAG: hypothetical protein EB066_08430, partial [Betaproteobacteria bacterium]|nr:hypothetical protein [Betaproteobacteria bacterium]